MTKRCDSLCLLSKVYDEVEKLRLIHGNKINVDVVTEVLQKMMHDLQTKKKEE